jgi:hypothetical protein
MKTKQLHTLLFMIFGLAGSVFAQTASPDWLHQMADPKANFFDIQKSFYSDPTNSGFKNAGENEEEDANGAELFRRYEYFAEPRLYPSGNRALLGKTQEEYQNYLKNHTAGVLAARASATQSTWTYFCPSGIPQGSGAGRVNCITVDPGSSTGLWIGSADGGLWKSTSSGSSWTTNSDLFTALGVSDIVYDPNNHQIIYVATGDKDGYHTGSPHAFSFGIQKSTDGGGTWNTIFTLSISNKPMISRILIDPTNSQNLYVSGNFGVSKSTDGGATWNNTLTGASILSMEMKPGTPGTLYASGKYFFRSTDKGLTWTMITSGLPTKSIYRESIGVTAANGAYVYVLAADSTNYSLFGVYQSTDGGTTFTQKTGNSPNLLGFSQTGSDVGKGQGFYTLSIGVSPTNASELMVGGVNIWKSTDGGATWGGSAITYWASNHTSSNYVHADIHHILYQNATTILVGCDGGIFKSSNGGSSWLDICSNLEISQLYGLGMSTTNPAFVLSGWQDNGTNLMTSSTSWQYALGGDGMKCFIDYSNDQTMYGEQYNGNFNISTNGGASWSNLGPPSGENTAWATPWKQDPLVANTIYGGQINLYQSPDQGTTWNMLGTQPDATNTITEFAIAPSNTQVIYVVKKTGVTKTTDGGTSWTKLTGLPITLAPTYLAVNAINPNIVYVTFSGYTAGSKVYASGDGGATWTNYSTGLPNLPANCITYAKASKGAVYVGMDAGVYFRDSTFTSWQPYITGLPEVIITQMEIYYPTKMLRASTFGRGIWEIPLYVPGIMTYVKEAVSAGELQVYPNPSKGLMDYAFRANDKGAYVLNIFSAQGKLVGSEKLNLTEGELYTKKLDLSACGAGMYLLTLNSRNGMITRKIIIE